MEEQKTFRDRCKEGWDRHKKKVGIALTVSIAVAGGCILAKKWDDVIELLDGVLDSQNVLRVSENVTETVANNVAEPVQEVVKTIKEVPVKAHPMKLATGKHASEKALALAEELDIILLDNQTVRRATTRHIAA